MGYRFHTRLNGQIALTRNFHDDTSLQKDKTLYKFIWVKSGRLHLEIDHLPVVVREDEIISLTPLHRVTVEAVEGDYLVLLFNSNFYCIYGHDNEVSCNGFLFNGTSQVPKLKLTASESGVLSEIIRNIEKENEHKDNLQEEMFRIFLKRFIIICTRIARSKFSVTPEKEKSFDIVRQFYVLVDLHFREKKKVQDYAEMLYRSPKTLSNLFSSYGLPSPLRIIHERTEAEAKRLLWYSSKSAKEISDMLGFEDMASFSRFFRNVAGISISEYRKNRKRE